VTCWYDFTATAFASGKGGLSSFAIPDRFFHDRYNFRLAVDESFFDKTCVSYRPNFQQNNALALFGEIETS